MFISDFDIKFEICWSLLNLNHYFLPISFQRKKAKSYLKNLFGEKVKSTIWCKSSKFFK